MEKTSKVIVLQLKNEQYTKPEYYASISALYRKHTREELGAVAGTLYNAISKDGYFDGAKAYIHRENITHASREK